jgi:hypothetical protein
MLDTLGHMASRLVFRSKQQHKAGLIELVVWTVPNPVPPSGHGFKYRLVYVVDGERVVGYDNERGKGDHKHLGGVEVPYRFVDVETLVADFMADVETA